LAPLTWHTAGGHKGRGQVEDQRWVTLSSACSKAVRTAPVFLVKDGFTSGSSQVRSVVV